MDRNSVIGLLLIGAIFIGYIFYNNQQQEKLREEAYTENKQQGDSLTSLADQWYNKGYTHYQEAKSDSVTNDSLMNFVRTEFPRAISNYQKAYAKYKKALSAKKSSTIFFRFDIS